MKELTGSATATTEASQGRCLGLLADVERYPDWHPAVVKQVEVLERDDQGQATKARTKLHVQQGAISRDFNPVMDVAVDPPGSVKLTRVPNEPSDAEKFEVAWRLNGDQPTQIRLDLAANLDVPRLLPLGSMGDSLAHGFVNAAVNALAAERDEG